MPNSYLTEYSAILVAAVIAVALIVVGLFLSHVLAPRYHSKAKGSTYECGMFPFGGKWSQVHVRYYLFAILFVIFDVETVFLYPWALSFVRMGATAFYEMVLFIAILLFGLAYAWRKGVLQWR